MGFEFALFPLYLLKLPIRVNRSSLGKSQHVLVMLKGMEGRDVVLFMFGPERKETCLTLRLRGW